MKSDARIGLVMRAVARGYCNGLEKNCVVLSTAHSCKFPKAIEDAISKTENLPESFKHINNKKERFELLSNDVEKVKKYVSNSI